jgi:GGDEF domain-containing protein
MAHAFYKGGAKLLRPDEFRFVLDSELKQALRSQSYMTLILIAARCGNDETSVAADQWTLNKIALVFGRTIRDTDFLGRIDNGLLGVVLWDADYDRSKKVIDRLVSSVESYDFRTVLSIAVGAACCPTHAVDLDSLKRQARARPVASWPAGTRLSPAEN